MSSPVRIIQPKALRRGDTIGICAPASAPATSDSIDQGAAYLERLGYRIELGEHVYRKRGYLAGTDTQRAADLNTLFANKHVKAIFTVRGGYGSHRILPLLDYDLIRRNPKIFVGYSDITALHLGLLSKAGLITFSGPMVASDMNPRLRGEAEERFWQTLTSTTRPTDLRCKLRSHSRGRYRSSIGRLIGGNLSLVSSLVGTTFFPRFRDPVLLLEEIDERPYRIDRMLRQITLAGILARSRGVVLGRFTDCRPAPNRPSLTLRQVFDDSFRQYPHPILTDLHYGHVRNLLTIPIGIRVRLSAGTGRISFLDSCVTR